MKLKDVKAKLKEIERADMAEISDEARVMDEDLGEEPDPAKDLNAWRTWQVKQGLREETKKKRVPFTRPLPENA